jgi:hypothetical protein
MKLLRLLRTGRSFVGSSDTARYQMGDSRAMPVFEGKVESAKPRAVEATVNTQLSGKQCAVSSRCGWFGRLMGKFARVSSKEKKPAIPQFNKPAVQGELSLERVKVVRNDLSDTDLEVVPAKAAATAGANKKAPVQPSELKANSSLTTTTATALTLALSPSEGEREERRRLHGDEPTFFGWRIR